MAPKILTCGPANKISVRILRITAYGYKASDVSSHKIWDGKDIKGLKTKREKQKKLNSFWLSAPAMFGIRQDFLQADSLFPSSFRM